jgi:hypothetical protein
MSNPEIALAINLLILGFVLYKTFKLFKEVKYYEK